jgi:hypothetical protein
MAGVVIAAVAAAGRLGLAVHSRGHGEGLNLGLHAVFGTGEAARAHAAARRTWQDAIGHSVHPMCARLWRQRVAVI